MRKLISPQMVLLTVVLFLGAILTLPGCKTEEQVLRMAHRMVSGYCLLGEEKREQVREWFNEQSRHRVKVVCGE